MLKVLFWETTDSKPKPRSTGMTHVAKHLDRILAEDQRIHSAEEIFGYSE